MLTVITKAMDSPVGAASSPICRSGSPRTTVRPSESASAQGKPRGGKGAAASAAGMRPGAQGTALPAPLSEAVYRKALEELPDGACKAARLQVDVELDGGAVHGSIPLPKSACAR